MCKAEEQARQDVQSAGEHKPAGTERILLRLGTAKPRCAAVQLSQTADHHPEQWPRAAGTTIGHLTSVNTGVAGDGHTVRDRTLTAAPAP